MSDKDLVRNVEGKVSKAMAEFASDRNNHRDNLTNALLWLIFRNLKQLNTGGGLSAEEIWQMAEEYPECRHSPLDPDDR